MTSPSYDLAGLGSVEVSFYFYPNSMENGEDFWLRYNDGSGWQTVATWASGTSFNNNTFYTATVTLDAATYNLTDGAQFRFQCDASGNADRVYIDEVVITGSSASGSATGTIVTTEEIPTFRRTDIVNELEVDMELYPNPASDIVSVRVEDDIQQIIVHNVQGQEMFRRDYEGIEQTNLDVSALAAGVYMISVQTTEELITERLVIHR
ncbi:MAG: T9SS type A sorting domain-containing protein [Bacteroidota bacterium]